MGFSTFAETTEPEEVMSVLRQYHAEMGRLVLAHEGTLEHFAGDGVVVLFNDPVEMPDHAERAVRMALAMRESARELNTGWGKHGWNMPLRIGVALGFATIGAVGRVVLQAAFLCGAAGPDRILVSQSVADAVESSVELEEIEPLTRHGFARTIRAFSVMGLKPPAEPGA
jgi:class 3 adenylate cyclase